MTCAAFFGRAGGSGEGVMMEAEYVCMCVLAVGLAACL